jgi:hypothetical protein
MHLGVDDLHGVSLFGLFMPLKTIMPKLPKSDNPEPGNRHFRNYPRTGHDADMPKSTRVTQS